MATSDAVVFDVQLTARSVGRGETGTAGQPGEAVTGMSEAAGTGGVGGRPALVVQPAPLVRDTSPHAALWELLGRRVERALQQALGGGALSVSDLTRILEEPSDVGATAALLEHAATAASVVAVDPLAAAKARWLRAEEELLNAAGGTLTAEDVATLLGGVTRQAVEKRRDRRTLLGLRRSGGAFVYPVCQFHGGDVLPGLDRFLDAFPRDTDPWQMLNVLVGPSEALNGQTPLETLRRGDVAGALEVAEAAFEERE